MAQWACYLEDKDLSVSLACLVLGRKLKEGMISHQWTIARVVMKVFLEKKKMLLSVSWLCYSVSGEERKWGKERSWFSFCQNQHCWLQCSIGPSTPFVYGWQLHCSCCRFWEVGALFPGKELSRWVNWLWKKSLSVDLAYFKTWARKRETFLERIREF